MSVSISRLCEITELLMPFDPDGRVVCPLCGVNVYCAGSVITFHYERNTVPLPGPPWSRRCLGSGLLMREAVGMARILAEVPDLERRAHP